jgi:DNA-binding PadR family transcriptional regulator
MGIPDLEKEPRSRGGIMTEQQKIKSATLDILAAAKSGGQAWKALPWITQEVRLAGRDTHDLREILDDMEQAGLVESKLDGLGTRRWKISNKGAAFLRE